MLNLSEHYGSTGASSIEQRRIEETGSSIDAKNGGIFSFQGYDGAPSGAFPHHFDSSAALTYAMHNDVSLLSHLRNSQLEQKGVVEKLSPLPASEGEEVFCPGSLKPPENELAKPVLPIVSGAGGCEDDPRRAIATMDLMIQQQQFSMHQLQSALEFSPSKLLFQQQQHPNPSPSATQEPVFQPMEFLPQSNQQQIAHPTPVHNAPNTSDVLLLHNQQPPPVASIYPTSPCGGCGISIFDRQFLLVGAQSWHAECARCSCCGCNLEKLAATCFARNGALYCRADYMEKFSMQQCCERCLMPIQVDEPVMIARTKYFHILCFTCSICSVLLKTGDQFMTSANIRGGLFCRAHFGHNNPSFPIPPTTSGNLLFHQTEHIPSNQICPDGTNCEPRTMTTSKENFIDVTTLASLNPMDTTTVSSEYFLTNSSSNGTIISLEPSQALHRTLSQRLTHKGQSQNDFSETSETNGKCDAGNGCSPRVGGAAAFGTPPPPAGGNFDPSHITITSPHHSAESMDGNGPEYYASCAEDSYYPESGSGSAVGTPSGSMTFDNFLCSGGNGSDGGSNVGGKKQKRVRTSFKHHQLRTMKLYFNMNHNPDAKQLKSLAQRTELPKRVLQVWFQNMRAKFRRGQHIHQPGTRPPGELMGGGSNGNGSTGMPSSLLTVLREQQQQSNDAPVSAIMIGGGTEGGTNNNDFNNIIACGGAMLSSALQIDRQQNM